MSTARAEASPHMGWRVSAAAAILFSVVIATLSCFREIYENDVGWHLALGRVFAVKGLVFENALAWTAKHYPWYPTSWLFDRLSWQFYVWAGPGGVQGFTLVLVLLVIAALVVALKGWRSGVLLLIIPATLLLLVPRISPRPHVATWFVVAWTLALARLGRNGDWRWRVAPLPIIALGSNLHQGAALATGVLGLFCIEAAWRERRWLREGLISVGAVLALMAIPGLTENIRSIQAHLKLDDVLQLIEYRPPTLTGPTAQPAFFVLLALALIAALVQWREEPANIVACGVVTYMAFAHGQRWIFEFFLLAAPLLAGAAAKLGTVRAALVLVILNAFAFASTYRTESLHFVLGPRFDAQANAVRAIQFMKDQGISGRLFNSYHDGGYVALMFPNPGCYMDSRPLAFPPGFFDREMRVEAIPNQFREQMRANDIEVAITTNLPVLSGRGLFHPADWALVYADEVNEVYLRRDVPRFAQKVAELEIK